MMQPLQLRTEKNNHQEATEASEDRQTFQEPCGMLASGKYLPGAFSLLGCALAVLVS